MPVCIHACENLNVVYKVFDLDELFYNSLGPVVGKKLKPQAIF